MKRSIPLATAMIVASACCFGSIAIFVTLAQRDGAPLLSILVWRFVLGGTGLFLLAGGPAALREARGRSWRLAALGGPPQAVINFTSLLALRWIPVATLVFLFYTYPSWIAVIAAVRGTERLNATRVAALVLSLGGIAIMVGAPSARTMHPAGVALALFAALVYALYIPFIGKLSEGVTARAASSLLSFGAAICFVLVGVVVLLFRARASAATVETLTLTASLGFRAWGAILLLAGVSTVAGFVLFLNGLPVLGAVRTGIVSTVEPFWASLLGALVLGQPLGAGTLIGGVAIALAVMLLQLPPRRGAVTMRPVEESIS
ncbi:MAG: DMT family transporter [Gemmatimonadaceae bacterium]|nr:DMT family transporter [Gemmatimonadaceae bacterium]